MMDTENKHPDADDYRFMRFLNKLVWASIPVLYALAGWAGKSIVDHETRIQIIENSRYTQSLGAKEREERIAGDAELNVKILETLGRIEKRLDRLEIIEANGKPK